jgi:Fe-Mn family superoxide dismutase
MPLEVRPLPFKPHRLDGLSERLLVSHYENNYGGAVRRLNAIERRLDDADPGTLQGFDINGLGRERLIAANSMILHEVYFDGLGGSGEPDGDMAAALERDFGSVAAWRSSFSAMGKALAGGSGWVLLTWSHRLGRLTNQWAADHCHCLTDGMPIMALDMYEHAYHLDFGANAAGYVDSVLRNLHWGRIAARWRRAEGRFAPEAARPDQITVGALRDLLERGEPVTILDVCLEDDLARRLDTIPGARFCRPEEVERWAHDLAPDQPIVVACIYGFQLSGDIVSALRPRGLDARQLAGGIAAWHAMAAPVAPLNTKAE